LNNVLRNACFGSSWKLHNTARIEPGTGHPPVASDVQQAERRGRDNPMSDFDEHLPRRDRWRRRRLAASAVVAVVVVLSGAVVGSQVFGDDRGSRVGDPASSATPTGAAPGTGRRALPVYDYSNEPSPVVLRLSDRDVELRPWTYCWSGPAGTDGTSTGTCADGFPSKVADLDDVGHPSAIRFWFGMAGWDFEATFTRLGVDRPQSFRVQAGAIDDHMFRLDPAVPAGRYQVDVFGRGEGGDVITSFVWTAHRNSR